MPVVFTILFACWAIFILYWIINARSVKPSKQSKWSQDKKRYLLISILLVFLIINNFGILSLLHIPACKLDWRGCHLNVLNDITHPPYILSIVSVGLTVIGLIVAMVARRTLADNWSAAVDLKVGHELITKGIYGYIRHPIYTGVFCMILGTVILYQSWLVLGLIFILACLYIVKIRAEEKLMTEVFPREYPAYKKRVKALIPFLI
jgi:protein-S-isoprenylcysteine O-methyltransferase Ste14